MDVNGLPTWHEVHGDGPPVVLLHGKTLRMAIGTPRFRVIWWPTATKVPPDG